jgi:hypothetical protein
MAIIRVTTAQADLLFGKVKGNPVRSAPRQPRPRKRRECLPENMLSGQIRGFLEAHGWVVTRQQSGLFTRPYETERKNLIRIGEKGRSDWRAERPLAGHGPGAAQLFYYETKASGKKPRPEQQAWLEKRAACGFLAAWFDSFDEEWDTSFLPWYRARFGEK